MENSINYSSALSPKSHVKPASVWLGWSAKSWFIVAAIGQWLFVAYITLFYGTSALTGNWEKWNEVLPAGHVPGDIAGNVAIGLHVFIAIIIIGGGPLQLIPQVRARAPKFHRILGRTYIVASIITSIAGLYMVWFKKGTVGGVVQNIGISVDAILIIIFSLLAIKYAMAKQLNTHRKWALRLFMVVNAVWFYRISLMLWLGIHGGPVGFDPKTFTGPFLNFLGFAQYLVPLMVLEFYFFAQQSKHAVVKYSCAVSLLILTLATAGGIFIAFNGMWLPRMH